MSLKEKFSSTIEKEFSSKKIVVVGDLMVDEYILGKVSRISPEAPVAVLNYKERRREAGGASNVSCNIRSLGAGASIVGVASNDSKGVWLRNHLFESGIETAGIFSEIGRPTTVKTRFFTKDQQLLRMDREDTRYIKTETQSAILGFLENAVSSCDAVLLSDYKKGVFGDGEFVRSIIKLCNAHDVFVGIDSKRCDIGVFENADFVKPNNIELEEAVGIKIEDDDSMDKAGFAYLEKSKAKNLIVTRGARGISVFAHGSKRRDYASKALQVFDVTGAGDTVFCTICLSVCAGLSIDEAVQLANMAASVVIAKTGTATVTQKELLKRISED